MVHSLRRFVCLAAVLAFAGGTSTVPAQQPDTLQHFIPAPPGDAQSGAQLGHSVAVEGGLTVVGAYLDDLSGSNSGVVKVFDSVTGALLHVLANPTPAAQDHFGFSVAISGTRVVVGANGDDTGATDAGSAYVYDLAGGTPTVPVATLNNPGPAAGDEFGTWVAIDGTTAAIGAPFYDTPQPDKGSVAIFADTITQPPTLSAPATGTLTAAPVSVSFTLPEAALAGSVKLIFAGPATRVLTLAASQESSGAHSFTFSPATPTASPEIASGSAIPDGLYTVTLSTQDIAGNPAATASATNVTVDTTPPVLTLPGTQTREATSAAGAVASFTVIAADALAATPMLSVTPPSGSTFALGTTPVNVSATDDAGNTATGSFTVTVQDTTAPVASVPAVLQVAAGPDGTVALGDLRSNVTRSDGATATENLTVTQTPPAATVLGLGSHAVSFTVTDAAGNFITVATTVGVSFDRAQSPGKVTVAAQSGAPAPAAVGLPADAVLATFGAPAVSDFRELAARVGMNSGKKRIAGIYFVDGAGAEELAAFAGGPAPGADGQPLAGAMFKSFLDPVLAPGGALAFAGTLRGPKKAVDQGVWTDAFGPLALVLREGAPVPGLQGELLKSITSLSLRDAGLLARVQLASGATAQSKVTPKNATALVLLTAAQTGQVLLRTGTPLDGVSGSLITSLSVLQPAPGSPGHGRWQGTGAVVAKVTLATGETRVVKLAPDGTATKLLSTADSPDVTLAILSPVAQWKSFGLPALDSAGQSQAVAAALVRKVGGVTANDDTLLLWSADGIGWTGVGRKGGATPIATPAGVRYASFFDPVANDGGRVAFLATLQGAGVTPKNRTALFSGLGNDPRLIARLGDAAPDGGGNATGARWSKFISHALPGGPGGGIVFLAETTGGDLPKSRLGLWAADSTGQLRRLLRTGAPVVPGGQVLTGLALLNALPGSYGTARSYNETGSLAVQATFADKTQALLRLDLP